jgi:hypothetical protein
LAFWLDDVFAVEKADVLRAAEIAQHRASFSARDAVHIAAGFETDPRHLSV